MENQLLVNRNILLCLPQFPTDMHYIINNFCGTVTTDINLAITPDVLLYVCGNIQNYILPTVGIIYIVKEFSSNYDDTHNVISAEKLPLNIHNVGVYFRNFFDTGENYFDLLTTQHQFQSLTESNKPNSAFRKGIYLTNVEKHDDELRFKLLRCSSNLDGPTENFSDTDNNIVNSANNISKYFFAQETHLNHVLAQIYENKTITDGSKTSEKKAKIKEHSDKTKDMPRNGIMAFCTFYNFDSVQQDFLKSSNCDVCYKSQSVLTKLRFRLKPMVTDVKWVNTFDITLYPNSIFLMSLKTNRLYTHEIIPSQLPIRMLPIRLGYVIRCSNTTAAYKNDQTYIVENDKYVKLEEPIDGDFEQLRKTYFIENTTDELMTYDKLYFSMNTGDYRKPIV